METKALLMDETAMDRTLMRLSHEITEHNQGVANVVLVGIKRRGEPLAKMIQADLKKIEGAEVPCGSVDISFYRDDLTHLASAPVLHDQPLPFAVNDRDVVLVDDVLYTGRTGRAAMEAVIACGRPRTIQFAVLVDRGHRELPIRADYVGKNVPTSRNEIIEVCVAEYDGRKGVFLADLKQAG